MPELTAKEKFEKWAQIHDWFKINGGNEHALYVTPNGEIIDILYYDEGNRLRILKKEGE